MDKCIIDAMVAKIKYLSDVIGDIIGNIFSNNKYRLSYIVEGGDWSIKMDGQYIANNLSKLNLLRSRFTTSCVGIKNQIVHFGSVNIFLNEDNFTKPHESNRAVLTWFHLMPEDKRNKNIIVGQNYLDFIHTSCNITKENLITLGVNPDKLKVIPLGVDLSLFNPAAEEEKQKLREELNIPKDKIVIGSFQKDGVGWGRGLKPKLIKGPDIFVSAVEKLSKNYPIFVLLAGPARGYIMKELEKRNISYKNIGYLKNFKELEKYYKALDLYIIASRIEGGPKQILEAWASGIPLVSTKVGMVPDISKNEENILLAEVENTDQIAKEAERIIKDSVLKKKLVKNGLEEVKNYSWEKIAERYYKEIYSKVI